MNEPIDSNNDVKPDMQAEDVEIVTDGADLDDSVVAEESAQEAIKTLRLKLKKALAEKQEYLNGWQKDKADFLNARKRDEAANKEMIKYANESLISELIAVLDSFSMAFSDKAAWEKVDKNWRVGVEYIANQFKKVLEDNGLTEIDPIGQKFDPMRDEAVTFEPVTDAAKDGVVTTVIQRGYLYNGRAVKAPKVKVGEFKAS